MGNYSATGIKRTRPSRVMDSCTGKPSDPAHVKGWVQGAAADAFFTRVLQEVPFAKNPKWSMGYKLPQSAYYYDEKARKKTPIPILEELAAAMESSFQCNVFTVWCNLYEDGGDHVEWHQDQYGYDLFTLSFGATRKFLMRPKGKKEIIASYDLSHGDVYFFSQEADRKNEHSVPKDSTSQCAQRVSILFFVDFPGSKAEGWSYNVKTEKYVQSR
eukprot:TRINITY_DN230_c0_g1_i5.p1 TRINITY_DN230_c0_g1~~TRINITY_DN230_c0_g1_i5.p1  ORF type:complete len:230 (+),score=53.94 TRINITY_DN230_c0_g1_i5:46-690(+)